MKLKYLGTAAAEGWPALFCRCEYCNKARSLGGKNIRTRSQSLVNDDLLIDLCPDTYMHFLNNNIDGSAIKYLLITHPHSDHFAPNELCLRQGAYAHNPTSEKLILAGPQSVIDTYEKYYSGYADEKKSPSVETVVLENYKTYSLGQYQVTPIRAHHMDDQKASCYHIFDGEKHLLYLHDTGTLFDDAFEYLENSGVTFDMVTCDCTFVALEHGDWGHLGLDTCKELKEKFLEKGIIDGHTVLCINHFSHNGILVHDELVPVAEKHGFLTAFDGMEVEF